MYSESKFGHQIIKLKTTTIESNFHVASKHRLIRLIFTFFIPFANRIPEILIKFFKIPPCYILLIFPPLPGTLWCFCMYLLLRACTSYLQRFIWIWIFDDPSFFNFIHWASVTLVVRKIKFSRNLFFRKSCKHINKRIFLSTFSVIIPSDIGKLELL